MKIFRVVPDVNHFQYFMFDDDDIRMTMRFDCSSKAENWSAPSVYVLKPRHKQTNFPDLWATASLVIDPTALEGLCDLLEMSGELLPLPYLQSTYHVLNVTECINVMDSHRTVWRYEPGSGPIDKYVFHASRLTESPLFKIPETCCQEILTCEGLKAPDDEFKGRVESLGLKGLIFEELWSD